MFGFDKMFDFNGDGHLGSLERAVQFQFLDDMENEESAASSYTDDADIFGNAGLSYDELEMMDPFKRRSVLTGAGLDPDEFDF